MAPDDRYAHRPLERSRHRDLDLALQLLWAERHAPCERDGKESHRYVQDTEHLDRELGAWLGAPHVADLCAPGRRFWSLGVSIL